MSYTWFRVDSSICGHPKELELAHALKDPNALAYIIRLWSWTQLYATTGEFPKSRSDQVEAFCRWSGEKGRLLRILVEVGLLETEGRSFFVHDWPEHQESLVEKSERDKTAKKLKRAKEKEEREETARAGRARGAPTDGRTDGRTDEQLLSLLHPHADPGSGETATSHSPPVENSPRADQPTEAHWGSLAAALVVWMQAERSMAGLDGDRDSDLINLEEWAWGWVQKYEPDERGVDQMHRAFLAFLADPLAPKGKSLSVWCSENVGLDRWDTERARDHRRAS